MYDEEIEKVVLYNLIFEQEEIDLEEEDFINAKNKQIFKAIKNLKNKKQEINIKSISDNIGANDWDVIIYISNMQDNLYKYKCSLDYAYSKIKNMTKKRKIFSLAQKMEKEIKDTEEVDIYIEKIIKELNTINSKRTRRKKLFRYGCRYH